MISAHRSAFPLDKQTKRPIETNIDKIINEASIKMRDLIAKKQNTEKETDLLVGQENILVQNIESLDRTIKNKESELKSLQSEYESVEASIKELEEKKKQVIIEANREEAKFKEGLNKINQDLAFIEDGTIQEDSARKAEIHLACEELLKIKDENQLLKDTMYLRNKELYLFENEYSNCYNDEKINADKAQGGIELITNLYKFQGKRPITRNPEENGDGDEEEAEESEQQPPKMIESNKNLDIIEKEPEVVPEQVKCDLLEEKIKESEENIETSNKETVLETKEKETSNPQEERNTSNIQEEKKDTENKTE